MSDFSFYYKKKNNAYIINASLENKGFGIEILANKKGWVTTSIISSENRIRSHNDEIRRCLIQYALYEISRNKTLKEDLYETTKIPVFYKGLIEQPLDKPYIYLPYMDPESFTETISKLVLHCRVYHGFVEEVVKVIYHVTKKGHKFSHLIRQEAIKSLEEEGFPFHPLTDEQIISSIKNNVNIQQRIQPYIFLTQHLLAIQQPTFNYSFTIESYENKNHFEQFKLKLNNSPLRFTADFSKNQLVDFSIEMVVNQKEVSCLSNESRLPFLHEKLYEFITKKSKYRTRFLF